MEIFNPTENKELQDSPDLSIQSYVCNLYLIFLMHFLEINKANVVDAFVEEITEHFSF